MNKRLVPWIQKIPVYVSELIEKVYVSKLYLVSESGPTSFVFKDDDDNKFKVAIGE